MKPASEESWCLSCHNYERGACRDNNKAEIAKGMEGDPAKQTQWCDEIDGYEAALEHAPNGRVLKMSSRFKPPVFTKVFKQSAHKASMVMPNFWPQDVHKREKGSDIADHLLVEYNFKGVTYKGIYLDPVAHPPVVGVIILTDEEKAGFSKEQEVGNSSENFGKGATKRLWKSLEKQSAKQATVTTLEDGSTRHDVKVPKRQLKKNASESSSNDLDWLATLESSGPQTASSGKRAKTAKKIVKRGLPDDGACSVSSEQTQASTSGPRPSPAKKSCTSSVTSGGGRASSALYKSVQLREINQVSALVSKYQPLDDSVGNAEGLRVISVEKIQAAIVIMEKKCTASCIDKLNFSRGPDDEAAASGRAVAEASRVLLDKLHALEFLARALTAKSIASGMFWQASAIEEGIARCATATVKLAPYAKERRVVRQVEMGFLADRPGEILEFIKPDVALPFGTFGIQSLPAASNVASVQEEVLLLVYAKLFEKGVPPQRAQLFSQEAAPFDWARSDELQAAFNALAAVVNYANGSSDEVGAEVSSTHPPLLWINIVRWCPPSCVCQALWILDSISIVLDRVGLNTPR